MMGCEDGGQLVGSVLKIVGFRVPFGLDGWTRHDVGIQRKPNLVITRIICVCAFM